MGPSRARSSFLFSDFIRRHALGPDAEAELERLFDEAPVTPVRTSETLDFDAEPTASRKEESRKEESRKEESRREEPRRGEGGLRYVDLEAIAVGGTAEVRRVHDRSMDRAVAMKVLLPSLAERPGIVQRFLSEARVAGRLDHPGIVPVHDVGETAEGRPFFTMREVKGRTLGDLIVQLHEASPPERWGETADGWTLPRLVDAWRRVCEALAYAHAQGVVHRDLKPENIMVGPYGEALVMDWGLARVGSGGGRRAEQVIAGTPMFMAPEQARGGFNTLDARSDVYALGILLYAILYGRPPFPSELSVPELLLRAGEGIGPPPRSLRPLPDELVELWREATALEPADRPADAGALASRVRAWQEGARRRDRAAGLVERAAGALDSADRCRAEAQAARSAALQRARAVQPWSPLSEKRAVWEAEDAATAAEVRAEIEEVTGVELLRAALTEDPTLPEARAALADRYQARHADAERRRDSTGAARWEALLRAVDDGRHAAWLKGEGRLSLVSQPRARVRALLYRLVVEDRRLVERFEADLGRGPLRAMTIPHGSWLIELHAPGYAPTRYPVFIERGGEWSGVPPGGGEVAPVPLVPEAELGRDGVYVPAGWAVVGGDSSWSASGSRQLVWIEGFICERHPVTNARFMAFLDALVASGAGEQADRFAPRWQTTAGETPASVYGLGSDGRHCLRPDADGDTWEPDWPVFLIERAAAEAFAAWEAARTGRPWRLPFELEWEKAARGVDGRTFPWGDTLDPAWACVRGGSRGRVLPAAITAHPEDESVYGVRGMGGNVQDWCQDAWSPGGPAVEEGRPVYRRAASGEVTVRGGAWNFPGDVASTAFRTGRMVGHRRESLGFRLFRSWPERSGAPEDPLRC